MSSSTRASHTLKSQDYHGLRRACHAKVHVHRYPRHPDDSILRVDDDRQAIAICSRHLPVDEQILHFTVTHRRRPEAISCSTVTNRQSAGHLVFRHDGYRSVERWHTFGRKTDLSRHHAADFGNRDLPGDGERPTELRNLAHGNGWPAAG